MDGLAKAGAANIDPYLRAALTRSGEIPLGRIGGRQFRRAARQRGAPARRGLRLHGERRDAAGALLDADRDDPGRPPFANPARHNGFTSSEILRAADGGFSIALSTNARPGNWLPLVYRKDFILVLRLYENEFSAGALAFEPANLPVIVKGFCR